MLKYTDIAPGKTAFVFELDNVLYPEKDYLYQVYYLFAGFLEYTELLDAKVLVSLMVKTFEEEGRDFGNEKLSLYATLLLPFMESRPAVKPVIDQLLF